MRKCIAMDFKAAEPRFFAAYTQDEKMLAALNDPEGRDFYKLLYSVLMMEPYEKVTDENRAQFKEVVLAIPYSLFDKNTTAKQLNISERSAEAIIDRYKTAFPKACKWVWDEIGNVTSQGFQYSWPCRKVTYQGLRYLQGRDLVKEQRRVINNKMQNSVSTLLKWSMVKIDESGLARIEVPVFDAQFCSVEAETPVQLKEICQKLTEVIKFEFKGVKFPVEWSFGDRWHPLEKVT